MNTVLTRRLLISLAIVASVPAFGANWPNWRGPDGNGVSSEKNLPLQWSTKENVHWRVELPGPGNSSPIVWGDRVFVAQFVEKESRRTLMSFDRATGKLLWQEGVAYTDPESTQPNNPYCGGTPATDGERVYVSFGSAGMYAYDFGGKEIWRRDLGKLNHMFGTAISPVLHGNLCIVNFGPGDKTRLIALNKQTGEIVWEVEPPKVDPSEQQPMGGPFGGPGGRGGPDGRGGPGGRAGGFGPGGRGGGFGPGMLLGPEANKDGSLTRDELKLTFTKWFAEWDSDKSGSLDEKKLRDGLNAAWPGTAAQTSWLTHSAV